MADECLPQVHCDVIRVTALNADGSPKVGSGNAYTTDALTTLTLTSVIKAGTDINEDNAQGVQCVSFMGPPSLRWGTAEIELCSSDPYLEAILSGGTTLDLGMGTPKGYAWPAIGPLIAGPVSIEAWAKRINDGDLDPDFPYAWWALPKAIDMQPAQRVMAAAAQKPKYMMRLLENPQWLDGPDGLWPAASDRVAQWVPTTTKPAVQCGPSAVLSTS